MRLVPKRYDFYHPVYVAVGLLFAIGGVYLFLDFGIPHRASIVLLLYGFPAIILGVGVALLIRQFQLRRSR